MIQTIKYTPSKYQQEIERVFVEENCSILVSAVAGSGKTTTLLQLLKKVKGSALFLAFNKSIVEELEKKVGFQPRVKIRTLHSIGQSAIMQVFGNVKLNDNKTIDFCLSSYKDWGFEYKDTKTKEWWRMCYQIKQLYGLYRMKLCKDSKDLINVCNTLGIEYDIELISRVLHIHTLSTKYNQRPKEIDFTDMVYLPAVDNRITFTSPDVTFVDECQDLNEAQHQMIDKIIKDNRFIAVGDRKQAIYGFTGSSERSFDKFLDKKNVKELPLSVCYRCGKKIVEHANEVFDIMKPFEHSEDGEVILHGEYLDAESGDMVICRNTMPLVEAYFKFLEKGKRCYIKGRDIGQSLISLCNKVQTSTSKGLVESLDKMLRDLYNNLSESEVQNPTSHPRYISLLEKVRIIELFAKKYYTKVQVEKAIEDIFSDEKSGVILSTIHKSKGLESEVVYFLDSNLLPSKYATTEQQLQQEENLKYVARTRAKKKLIYCRSI